MKPQLCAGSNLKFEYIGFVFIKRACPDLEPSAAQKSRMLMR